jgi:tetratricopeptide (TPR) repeat protein
MIRLNGETNKMITDRELSSFGAQLKTFRVRRHLTQQHLAEAVGVHRNAIGRWEQGDFLPASKAIVLELANQLHLDSQETRQLLEASLTALSPHWSVPLPRNPFFTGREEILETLHAQLSTDQAVALAQSSALHGLGGIGKTQIALEYAYRHALEYSAVFWIGAETDEQIITSLLRIAEMLQLPGRDDKDQQRVVVAVQRWLSTHGQWLLIWDNVEDLALLDRFLPSVRQGAILITTRCQALGTFAQGLDLLPMEQEEGMLFLLRRAKVLEPEATREQMRQLTVRMPLQYAAAAELIETMGGLPLALDQVGAYIEETGCSLSGYLQRYEQQHARLLNQRGGLGTDHPQSVTATFLLTMEQLEREQCLAADMLRVCALLHAEAIPAELFGEGSIHLGPGLEPLAADPSQLDQSIAALLRLSLVRRHPETETLSLHRLVQVILREDMSEQVRATWQRRLIHTLNVLFPEVTSESTADVWKQCERFLPHVLAVATQMDQEGDQALVGMLGKAADYLCERVQYEQARPLYERAVHLGEQVLGPQHPNLAYPLTGLATLYRGQGKFEQAEPLYERALSLREQALGPEHPLVTHPLIGLAILYAEQGKFEQAEPLYKRALSLREQALGPEHPLVTHPLIGLAILYKNQGKFAQAESLYERALFIRAQAHGPEHPQMSRLQYNLARLYQEQGKYEQAEPLFRQALRIEEHTWGPEHPNVFYPLSGLAILYQEQGKDEQAEPLFRRTLDLAERAWGPEHLQVAYPLYHLAILLQRRGKYEQAEQLAQRALCVAERAWGPEHPQTAHPLNSLAILYTEQGKFEQAEPLYERVLSIREQHLGQHHPETAQTLHDLALFRQKQGNLSEAISLTERTLRIRSQSLGDAHPKTAASRTLYTQLLQKQTRAQEEVTPERSAGVIPASLREERYMERASLPLHKADHPSSSENDSLQGFLDTCCELHPRAWCRISDLWQTYEQWTTEHQGRAPLPRRAFAAQVKARGCRADRTSTARIWRGIRLVNKNP